MGGGYIKIYKIILGASGEILSVLYCNSKFVCQEVHINYYVYSDRQIWKTLIKK